MPATSQEPSGRLPRPGRVRKAAAPVDEEGVGETSGQTAGALLALAKAVRQKNPILLLAFFIRCGSLYPQSHRPRPGLRFGPDVFADALVPRRRSRPHCFSHRHSEWPSGVPALLRRLPRAAQIALLAPMVIVSPNRTVNRIPQIARQSSKTAVFPVL